MILTQCAVCAIELGTGGKECGQCQTRYCGPECQEQHWEEGDHDQLCKHIERAGGAEQFYANTKYTEAVAVAAEACADDTKGQTCYGLLAGPEYSSDDSGDGPAVDDADLDELSRRVASQAAMNTGRHGNILY